MVVVELLDTMFKNVRSRKCPEKKSEMCYFRDEYSCKWMSREFGISNRCMPVAWVSEMDHVGGLGTMLESLRIRKYTFKKSYLYNQEF